MRLSERNEAISPPSLPSPLEGEGGVGGVSVKREDGFTLIEIILAIIVISIGVLGLVSAISFTAGKGVNAEVVSTAQVLAQERMEELMSIKRNNGYSDPTFNIGPTTITFTPLPAPFDKYSRGEQICLVDQDLLNPDCDPAVPNNDIGYKRITVSINFSGLPDLPSPVVSLVSVVTDVRE